MTQAMRVCGLSLGLRETGGPGLTFALADGSERELITDPLPIEAFRDLVAPVK